MDPELQELNARYEKEKKDIWNRLTTNGTPESYDKCFEEMKKAEEKYKDALKIYESSKVESPSLPPKSGSSASRPRGPINAVSKNDSDQPHNSIGMNLHPSPRETKPSPAVKDTAARPEKRKAINDDVSMKRSRLDNDLDTSNSKPTKRSIAFDDVRRNATEYGIWDKIVEFGKVTKSYYILFCDAHKLGFKNKIPAYAAGKHLDSPVHGKLPRDAATAIEHLGYIVTGCTAAQVDNHNQEVDAATENGWTPVGIRRSLKSGKIEGEKKARRSASQKILRTARVGIRAATGIQNPKTFHVYNGVWDNQNWPILILGWDLQSEPDIPKSFPVRFSCLEDTGLLQKSAKPPICYIYEGKKINSWAEGFEDGGPHMHLREFPVMFFNEQQETGWMPGSQLSKFDMYKVRKTKGICSAFNNARKYIAQRDGYPSWDKRQSALQGQQTLAKSVSHGSKPQLSKPETSPETPRLVMSFDAIPNMRDRHNTKQVHKAFQDMNENPVTECREALAQNGGSLKAAIKWLQKESSDKKTPVGRTDKDGGYDMDSSFEEELQALTEKGGDTTSDEDYVGQDEVNDDGHSDMGDDLRAWTDNYSPRLRSSAKKRDPDPSPSKSDTRTRAPSNTAGEASPGRTTRRRSSNVDTKPPLPPIQAKLRIRKSSSYDRESLLDGPESSPKVSKKDLARSPNVATSQGKNSLLRLAQKRSLSDGHESLLNEPAIPDRVSKKDLVISNSKEASPLDKSAAQLEPSQQKRFKAKRSNPAKTKDVNLPPSRPQTPLLGGCESLLDEPDISHQTLIGAHKAYLLSHKDLKKGSTHNDSTEPSPLDNSTVFERDSAPSNSKEPSIPVNSVAQPEPPLKKRFTAKRTGSTSTIVPAAARKKSANIPPPTVGTKPDDTVRPGAVANIPGENTPESTSDRQENPMPSASNAAPLNQNRYYELCEYDDGAVHWKRNEEPFVKLYETLDKKMVMSEPSGASMDIVIDPSAYDGTVSYERVEGNKGQLVLRLKKGDNTLKLLFGRGEESNKATGATGHKAGREFVSWLHSQNGDLF